MPMDPAPGHAALYPRRRLISAQALTEVDAALAEAGHAPGALDAVGAGTGLQRDRLIEYLHALNDRHGGLRRAHLVALARRLRLATVEVYEVASFYHHFTILEDDAPASSSPLLRICTGLPCALAGSEALLASCQTEHACDLRIQAVPCVGHCEQAPVAVLGQRPIGKADRSSIHETMTKGDTQEPMPSAMHLAKAGRTGSYAQLLRCLHGELTPESVLTELTASGLRGLGGAGFPTARKWAIVRAQPAPRLMAVNLDEGEPGTFKDRVLLERDVHRFLEGMLIAAWVVGAEAIYLYLRDEYPGLHALLRRELTALAAQPFWPGMPRLELRRGAGAYICGEESAMIESIEGKRGLPRLRPPYVAERGLFGRPTLVNNAETLWWLPEILARGGAAFAALGRRGHAGMRAFSVSGRVRQPGVQIAPNGVSARELIEEYAGGMAEGHKLYAFLPGGASGGILPASLAEVPLAFDSLAEYGSFVGSGALIVLSEADRAVLAARNLLAFFAHESCGQCTPCRVGCTQMQQMIAGETWDKASLTELARVMQDASICGLGQAAPNPVLSVLKYFPQEIKA